MESMTVIAVNAVETAADDFAKKGIGGAASESDRESACQTVDARHCSALRQPTSHATVRGSRRRLPQIRFISIEIVYSSDDEKGKPPQSSH
ncbi:hypothetical protein [Trinickia symbiotica]|uniref:hypothetical protein n=1 Tax=Trinickia symbiotica TaxID=863227 RepID=UPI0011AFCFCB|nr:hypothetical protein [Trinickia symbiotica]